MEELINLINHSIQVPFAKVTFPYDTSLYELKHSELMKVKNNHVARGTTHHIVYLNHDEDVMQLDSKLYVQQIAHHKPCITYGKIEVFADVKVCTRTGLVQRIVREGANLNVLEVIPHKENPDIVRYRVGKESYISSLEAVKFTIGSITVANNENVYTDGSFYKLTANVPYFYDKVHANLIHLMDLDIWVDVSKLGSHKYELI